MIQELESGYEFTKAQIAEIESLREENARLRAALGFAEKAAHSVLIAGGDYGDELSDYGLRDLLRQSRDLAGSVCASVKGGAA